MAIIGVMQIGMTKGFLMTLLWVCLFPGVGAAYCYPPDLPDSPSTGYRPYPPSPPYCLDLFSGTHRCEDWEIDSYNDAIRQYKYELEGYIRKLKQYVSDAGEFANEALNYAECEISDLQ